MRARSISCALAFALALSSVARADVAKDPALAKRHFDAGIKLYKERSLPEALVEFDLSYRLGGRPSALKNVAQCERDLKHFAEAYVAYARLLAEHGDKLGADKAGIERAVAELAVLTGAVRIKSNDTDADVEIDGKSLGRTPIDKPRRLSLGAHKLHVTKAGFEPFDKELSLSSEQELDVDVTLALEVTTGRVSIREAGGRDVHVFIDGVDKGAAPYAGELPPGEHTLEARGDKYAADKRIVTIVRREKLDLVVDASPVGGHLRVTATPLEAHINVDGADHGTGAWEDDLPPGVHRVTVALEGYPTAVREVNMARGATLVVELPLTAPSGPAAPVYKGVYGGFGLMCDFGFGPTYQLPPGAPSSAAPHDDHPRLGPGGRVYVGYAFDWWGIEFSGLFNLIIDDTDFMAGSEQAQLRRVSFFGIVGAGARITTKHDTVRFTFGAGPGLSIRSINFKRSGSGNSCMGACSNDFSATAGYVAPAILMDAGMLLGNTPGAKFYLGINAWADFPRSLAVGPDIPSNNSNGGGPHSPFASGYFDAPGRGWKATYGPEFFLGPMLGVRWGH